MVSGVLGVIYRVVRVGEDMKDRVGDMVTAQNVGFWLTIYGLWYMAVCMDACMTGCIYIPGLCCLWNGRGTLHRRCGNGQYWVYLLTCIGVEERVEWIFGEMRTFG